MKYKDFNSVDVDNLAKQYGYSYTPIVDAKNINEDGLYCNPMSKTIKHDVLSFSVDGVYCELFTAQFQVVFADKMYGVKEPITQGIAVFSIKLPYDTAPVYIESRTNRTINNILGLSKVIFPRTTRVILEGDFNKFFRVYARDKQELDAFTTLAPNVMLRVMESMGEYDIEFANDNVYIYHTMMYSKVFDSSEIWIPYTIAEHEELLQIGVDSAKHMARASRPSRIYDRSKTEVFWKFTASMSTKEVHNAQDRVISMLIAPFIIVFVPYLWPVGALLIILILFRYTSWNRRRKRLVERWSRSKKQTQLIKKL